MPHILAESLTIEFPLYHMGARSLKKRILAKSPLRLREDASHRVVVAALRDLPSGSAAANAWRWSAATAPARPRCCGRSPGSTSRSPAGCEVAGPIGSLIDPVGRHGPGI